MTDPGSSDPDGTVGSYDWDFGGNTAGSGVSVTHTYDRFITGEGKYPRLMFVCRKRF
jgi:hypothetical protein